MVVNDVQSAVNYIKSIVSTGMNPMAEEMKNIMQSEVNEQIYADHEPTVYERTGQMGEIVEIKIVGTDYTTVEFKDNGDWMNASETQHFFPLLGWEAGMVWRVKSNNDIEYYPPTNIIDDSKVKINTEIPQKLKGYLISQGLDVI